MRRVGFAALLGGAAAFGAVSVHAAPLITLSLNLPTPIVAPDQVMSPSAIAVRLGKQGFRVDEMYRKGLAYAVTADGPSGNKVLLMVDGRSGVILGLNVLAAKAAVVPQRTPNAVYIDDRHPFGAVVPAVVYVSWQQYQQPQWAQPGPATLPAPKASMAPFRYAVPTSMVHASPKTGKSFAVAPPHYKGMQLRNQNGQPIKSNSESKSDAADAEAAYQSERADKAEYDKTQAQEDAIEQREEADDANGRADEANGRADEANGRADEANGRADEANGRADQAEQDRDAFSQAADDAEARATAAEDKNIELQRQMDANGTADQDCSASDGGCQEAEGEIAPGPDNADEEAEPADHTSAEGQPADEVQPGDRTDTAEDAAPAKEDAAPPAEEEAQPQDRTDTAEDAAPAKEEAAPPAEEAQPQEQTAPTAEEAAPQAADPPEAAPEPQAQPDEAPQAEEPQQQEEEQPQAEEPQQDDSPDMGGGGGGGDDGGGGGGGDDDPN